MIRKLAWWFREMTAPRIKATYQTRASRLTIEVEARSVKSLFRRVAEIQAVFDAEACGCCQGTNLQFRVVKAEGVGEQYVLYCLDCTAALNFVGIG